jgi:hypothetical protein
LLLNFRNEPEIYNLLPSSIPPISPSISTTNFQNCNSANISSFLDSFKKEEQINEDRCLNKKRKRLNSNSGSSSPVDDILSPLTDESPTETNCSTSSIQSNVSSSSQTNSFETNLSFIKEMLSNLKQTNSDLSNCLSTKSNFKNLYETIKTKLETNSYQSIEDLNKDISLIKEYSNSNENVKRIKFSSCHNNLNTVINEDLC